MGALRVVRWSARYDQTVVFYRDVVGLAVLETFQESYGLDGTILGLPDGLVHLEIVRLTDARHPAPGLDQLVFYLPDAAAQERVMARLAAAGVDPVPQIDYWQDNGGVTYQDPDGREVVFASWIYRPPGGVAMSDQASAPAGSGSEAEGGSEATAEDREAAMMRQVMRMQERHREGGVDPDLGDTDADAGPES